jgi:hypothetical protein
VGAVKKFVRPLVIKKAKPPMTKGIEAEDEWIIEQL